MNENASRARQRLLAGVQQHQRLLQALLKERGPLTRGSFGTRARVCGVAGCHCARGERHESKYLSVSSGGRTYQTHVPSVDEVEVARATQRYRQFQDTRLKLGAMFEEQLELINSLLATLLRPYPADAAPLPPTTRGRPRKTPGK
jgi:hypothetical protein